VELVVQAVLARDERRAEGQRPVVAGAAGLDEVAEVGGVGARAPREVVEDRGLVGVAADGHDVAQRLVDGGQRHAVGVDVAPRGQDAAADGEALAAAEHGRHDRRVRGAVASRADERLDHRAGQHLVVVLADDPLLARDVGRREQLEQQRSGAGGRQVGRVGDRAAAARGLPRLAWQAFVEEARVEVHHARAAEVGAQPAVAGEGADHGGLDVLGREDREERGLVLGRHGEDHALLRLADPDLAVGQAVVLERHALELHVRAALGAHLADRRGQARPRRSR
jgi:hypothetical protein